MKSANDRLVALLHSLPRVQLENRLMRAADREIALSLRFMEERERDYLLSVVAPEKRKRIRDELALQRRIAISLVQYDTMVENLVKVLSEDGFGASVRNYLRPIRGKRPPGGVTRP